MSQAKNIWNWIFLLGKKKQYIHLQPKKQFLTKYGQT